MTYKYERYLGKLKHDENTWWEPYCKHWLKNDNVGVFLYITFHIYNFEIPKPFKIKIFKWYDTTGWSKGKWNCEVVEWLLRKVSVLKKFIKW